MIKHKYGEFTEEQLNAYKKKLHKKMFWLLLYKDPKTKDSYPEMDGKNFKKYFEFLMKEIAGLNELLNSPSEIIEILSLLMAAWLEVLKEEFDYQSYRKLILDAHHLIDKIKGV